MSKSLKAMSAAAKKPQSKGSSKPERVPTAVLREKLRDISATSAKQEEESKQAAAAASKPSTETPPWEETVTTTTTPTPPAIAEAQSVLKSLAELGLYTGQPAVQPPQQTTMSTTMPPVASSPAAPTQQPTAMNTTPAPSEHPLVQRAMATASLAEKVSAEFRPEPAPSGFIYGSSLGSGMAMTTTPPRPKEPAKPVAKSTAIYSSSTML